MALKDIKALKFHDRMSLTIVSQIFIFNLQFYKHCSRWQEQVDDQPQGGLREKIRFLQGAEFSALLTRVAARFGINQISQGK
jgi:hypothetical protein